MNSRVSHFTPASYGVGTSGKLKPNAPGSDKRNALSEGAKDVVYFRKFTRGLVPTLPLAPTVLSTDNKAARDLSYNPEHHGRSKHIERRHFYIGIWLRRRRLPSR